MKRGKLFFFLTLRWCFLFVYISLYLCSFSLAVVSLRCLYEKNERWKRKQKSITKELSLLDPFKRSLKIVFNRCKNVDNKNKAKKKKTTEKTMFSALYTMSLFYFNYVTPSSIPSIPPLFFLLLFNLCYIKGVWAFLLLRGIMGRGYSNSRCKSARPTLGTKRHRSLSMQRLKDTLVAKPPTSAVAAPRATHKTETPAPAKTSAATVSRKGVEKSRSGTARGRSASTIRQRMHMLQTELADVLEPSENPEETIVRPDVMTKYKSAGRAIDEVLDIVAAGCVPGANTKQLCDTGDEELLRRVRAMFSKAKDAEGNRIPRGLAYPTNVSVNHTLCNHAPLAETEAVVLQGGDVVKIHMGCHVDGYPVSAARTIIVPRSSHSDGSCSDNTRPLTAKASGAIEAARVAIHGMIHLLHPGAVGADITDFIHRVGNHFEVEALEGVLSNRTKRWVPDGMDCIITRRVTLEDPHQDVADCQIGANEVWTLDVAFTDHTSYKVVPAEEATTMYRCTEVGYQQDARIRSVHSTLQEISEKHQCFPFSLKHVENPMKARMAATVLRKDNVIDPIPVLRVKGDRHVTARFSATVSVSERRLTVLCGLPPAEPLAVSDDVRPPSLPSDIAEVLAEPLVFPKDAQPQQKKARVEKEETDKKMKKH